MCKTVSSMMMMMMMMMIMVIMMMIMMIISMIMIMIMIILIMVMMMMMMMIIILMMKILINPATHHLPENHTYTSTLSTNSLNQIGIERGKEFLGQREKRKRAGGKNGLYRGPDLKNNQNLGSGIKIRRIDLSAGMENIKKGGCGEGEEK